MLVWQYLEVGLALKLLADSADGVGYLLQGQFRVSDIKEFVASVRRVADGGSALDPMIVCSAGSTAAAVCVIARQPDAGVARVGTKRYAAAILHIPLAGRVGTGRR